jgi:hypothetical protein
MVQVVECLPHKCETLSSTKKKKKERKKIIRCISALTISGYEGRRIMNSGSAELTQGRSRPP